MKKALLVLALGAVLLMGAPAVDSPAYACPNVREDYLIIRYYTFAVCGAEPCDGTRPLVGEEHFYCDGSYYMWGTYGRFTDTISRPCEFCGPEGP